MFMKINRKHWLLALSAALLAALLAATTVFAEGEEPPAAPAAEETAAEAPAPVESEPAPEPEAAPPEQMVDDPPTEEPLTEEPAAEPTLEEPAAETPAEEPAVEPPLEEPTLEPSAEEPAAYIPTEEPAADVPAESVPENAPVSEVPAETAVEPQAAEPAADKTAAQQDGELLLVDESGAVLEMASVESAELLSQGDPYFTYLGLQYHWQASCPGTLPAGWGGCTPTGTTAASLQALLTYLAAGSNPEYPSDGIVHILADPGAYNATYTLDATIGKLSKVKSIIGDGSADTFLSGNLTIQNYLAGFTLQGFDFSGGITFINNSGTIKVTDVKVKNTSGDGLTINGQRGAVVLSNVRADGSASRGAWLSSGTGTYTVSISNSTFNDNCTSTVTSGLDISNFLGAITLDGVSANHNNGSGARIQSDISGATAALTIRNAIFNDNHGSGKNGLVIEFNTARPVTLENVSAMRNINHRGISITTYGAVILRNVRAEGNQFAGAYIHNSGGGVKPVTVTNSIFSNNTLGTTDGLTIYSYGTVTLTSIRAENNTGNGVNVDNCSLSSGDCLGSGTVTINSPAASGQAAVNVFNNNGAYGLYVYSRGAISLTNFYADENDGSSGVYLNNQWSNSSAAVTVGANIPNDAYGSIWYNSAFHNFEDGVEVFSNGAVSISKVNASANQLVNIDIKNELVPDAAPKPVTLNYIVTKGTYAAAIYSQRGIDLETKGNVTASNITADQHAKDGVRIDTCQESGSSCLGSGSVSITSTGTYNSFSKNYRSGISVYARGAITLKNFVALSNGDSSSYDGVYLSNNYTNGSGTITLDATLPQPFRNEVSGNTNYGIQVNSKGAIILGRTLVKDNTNNNGAYLNNPDAPFLPVTVRFSEFSGNDNCGLHVVSKGQITLTNVISEKNTNSATGASLNNSYTNGGGVTINTSGTFTNRFDYNGNTGLDIQTYGAVQISNTQANGNGNYNIYINNSGASPASPKTVTLTNVSASGLADLMAVNNTVTGVYVESRGTVTLTNVKAYDHTYDGIYVYLYPPEPRLTQPAVVLSNSISSRNGDEGIHIYGLGSVTLNNTSADNNGAYGAYIDNCYLESSYCTGKGGVTIKAPYGKYASFSHNGSNGLMIYTSGAAALTNIKAEGNGQYGASIYQQYTKLVSGADVKVSGNLTVSGSGVPGVFNSNGNQGLYILSFGTVNVSNVEARYNHYYGMSILNEGASAAPGVNLTDINANYNWDYGGVIVQSKGPVTLKGIDASDNNVLVGEIWDGRKVVDHLSHTAGEDQWWFSTTGPYTVDAALNSDNFDAYLCLYEANGSLLICADGGGSGSNAKIITYGLANAGKYYLAVHSADGRAGGYDLTLGILSNTDYFNTTGLSVDNSYSDTNTAVTISPSTRGYGVKANDNIGNGVVLTSDGLVSVSKAWAGYNANRGFEISNYTSGTEAGVTLNTVYADENGDSGSSLGLYLRSKGAISWTTGSASGNTYGGAEFYNNESTKESTKFAAVSISGVTASFNKNWGSGLNIYTKGAVTLANLTANKNGIGSTGAGVTIDNCQVMGGTCAMNANVTITGTRNQFNENTDNGVYIDSGGLVTLTNFTANDNTHWGIRLINVHPDAGGVSIKRTITGMNEAIGNDTHGVDITSDGAVQVEKLKATDNDYFNLFVNNQNDDISPAPGVTVKTTWVEGSGNDDGLYIESYGSIMLDGVKAFNNLGHGAAIYNDEAPTTPAPVTVLRSVFENNDKRGLSIYASGNILLGGLRARSNGYDGVNAATTDGNVAVSDAYGDNILSFNGTNAPGSGAGLNLYNVYGTISIKRVIATDNSYAGIFVENEQSANPGGAVTINNVTVANNLRYGICAYVKGSLSVSGAKILDNGRGGSYAGLYVEGFSASMPLTVTNSTIMGNLGYGIYMIGVTSKSVTSTLNIGNALGPEFP